MSLAEIRDKITAVKKITPDFFLKEEIFASIRRKTTFKKLSDIIGAKDKALEIASKELSQEQEKLIVECVNYGIFKKEGLSEKIAKIVSGWKGSPKSIDARIKRYFIIGLNHISFKKKKDEGEDLKEVDNSRITSIEENGSGNGFTERFKDRILKIKETYDIGCADDYLLRAMAWAEIELDSTMAKQVQRFSLKRLDTISKMVTLIKTCMESLKLTRKQRKDKVDDGTEREMEKKYQERKKDKGADSSVIENANRSKKKILEFNSDEFDEFESEEEICDKCFNPSCKGDCED